MADEDANDIVKERDGEGEEGKKGGNTKLFIIIGAVLVLASGGFVMLQMQEEPAEIQNTNKKIDEKDEEDQTDFAKLREKPVLIVGLGEIICPMRRLSAGVTRRARIKLDPALVLKPYYNYELQIFDADQNTAMVERFESLKPLLRQIVINTILDSDPNEEPDPRTLSRRIMKHINNYDATTKEVKGTYDAFFGSDRVIDVLFKTFEPR